MFSYPIVVYDNFDNVKYIFSNGPVKVNEKTISKYISMKDIIILKLEYEEKIKFLIKYLQYIKINFEKIKI